MLQDRLKTDQSSRRAFTLVELLAAIVVIGIVASIGVSKYRGRQEKTLVATAIMQLQALQIQLVTMDPLPATLDEIGRATLKDPWGRPYIYNRFTVYTAGVPVGARRDRNLRPINASYDLYSVGKDGITALALTASGSVDDIVVANDGKFVGLASKY